MLGHLSRESAFKYSFFPASLGERFYLDPSTRNSETIKALKQKLMLFIRPLESSIFNIFQNPRRTGITYCWLKVTWKNIAFWHNFQECTCNLEKENNSHYLLHCHHNTPFRTDLTNSVETFVVDFESLSDRKKAEILLYGDSRCDNNQNNSILSASIN